MSNTADTFFAHLLVGIQEFGSKRVNFAYENEFHKQMSRGASALKWALSIGMEEVEAEKWSIRAQKLEELTTLDVERLKNDIIAKHFEHLEKEGFGKKPEKFDYQTVLDGKWEK